MLNRLSGNERAKRAIKRMLSLKRVPGVLLFSGEDGVGKKLFALEIAKALNCMSPEDFEACDRCSSCQRIADITYPASDDTEANKAIIWSSHPDVGLIRTAGRFIQVSQMRLLEKETNFRPYEGRVRFFIVENADTLNEASSNALLKTLEEIPPTSHIVLLTSKLAKLLPTIKSRCQIIGFSPVPRKEIEEVLKNLNLTSDKLGVLACMAQGSIGRAMNTEVEKYCADRLEISQLVEAIVKSDLEKVLRFSESLSDPKKKDDYELRLGILETMLRDLWLIKIGDQEERIINRDLIKQLTSYAQHTNTQRISTWMKRIEEIRQQLNVNINRKAATDALLLSMT
jgi:DNA polymerase III subunit delta'